MRRWLVAVLATLQFASPAWAAIAYKPQPVSQVGSAYSGNLIRGIVTEMDRALRLIGPRVDELTAPSGGGAPKSAAYVTLSHDATLTGERVITGTTNQINLTDGGANGSLTLSAPQNLHTGASFRASILRGFLQADSVGLIVRQHSTATRDLVQFQANNGTDSFYRMGSDGQSYFTSSTSAGAVNIGYISGGSALKIGTSGSSSVLSFTPTSTSDISSTAATNWTTSTFTTIGKAKVDGAADAVQFTVEGNGTQTSDLQRWQTSVPATLSGITSAGNYYLTSGGALNRLYTSDVNGVGSWQSASSAIGKAFTANNETNIGLTLNGTPATSLLDTVRIVPTWTGTLAAPRGGTGFGSYATGDLLYASSSSALSRLAIGGATQYLRTTGGFPTWTNSRALTVNSETNITLTTNGSPNQSLLDSVRIVPGWSGQLSLARGGTAANLTASNGSVVYSTATAHAHSAVGSSNDVLRSGGAGAPTWSTPRAFTTNNETNITLTANGTPSTALLDSIRLVPGWSGTLAVSRGGTGVSSLSSLTASPSDSVTLTTTNGSASTFMRSDAAPRLSQFIAPSWRADHMWVDARPIIKGEAAGPLALQWWNNASGANGTLNLQASPAATGAVTIELPNAPGQTAITGSGSVPPNSTEKIGKVNRTGVTDTIAVTNLTNITGSSIATGFYMINAALSCTVKDTTTTLDIALHFTWTDDAGLENAIPAITCDMARVNSTNYTRVIYVSSGNISYGVRNYQNPAGDPRTPAYAVRIRVTFMGT